MMKVKADNAVYDINPERGRYAALYHRYHVGYADGFDTPEDAAEMLNDGEDYGELSSSGIYDTQTQTMLASKERYRESDYDWMRAIAMEVPVREAD